MISVHVIGAGIMGLSTAIQIQEAMLRTSTPASVTIVADKFHTETTSDGAAGNFRPTADLIPGVPRDTLYQWCKDSWSEYDRLAHSPDAGKVGVGAMPVYHFFTDGAKGEQDCIFKEFVYDYKDLSQEELKQCQKQYNGLQNISHGQKYTTLLVEGRFYLPYLMDRFKSNGGKFERRTIKDVSEFAGRCDLLVNCSGLGSRALFNDTTFAPTRGHMLRVHAPWLKQAVYVNNNTWIIPGQESTTVGGTRKAGDYSMEPRPEDAREIWERACSYIPSLQGGRWLWQWIGIRPIRAPVRVESETLKINGKSLKVVHNYGHGGNGIALGWGCSRHAAKLALESLGQQSSKL